VATREQNERKFTSWETTPNGGRIYRLDVPGRHGWSARYLKQVGADETTLRFWQEIYDDQGTLIEPHQKFAVNTGHQKA
jgi:hypothetical protein